MCPKDDGLQTSSTSYVLTVIDDYSRYAAVAVVSSKVDAAENFKAIANRRATQTGNAIQAFRFDRGSEFYKQRGWMSQKGIIHQSVPARTPEGNGRAERLNRTLLERVRALLYHFNLPSNLSQFAMEVAAYTRKLVPSLEMDTTPHELFYSTKPCVDNLRVFGCSAMVWVPAD